MKKFLFISPHFPDSYYQFVRAIKRRGFITLGIGDAPYHELPQGLKDCLDEYYVCYNMDNFDNEINAVRYFVNKYGQIDYLESNNEYWLEKDAKLREIFNIPNGVRSEDLAYYQHKSLMKQYYQKAGVKVAQWTLVDTFDQMLEFVKKVGYPIFIKPDQGVGAEGDFKISNIDDLKHFFEIKNPRVTYIAEQFLDGNIISFDGISNSKADVIFFTSNVFPPSIADVVENKSDVFYYTVPKVSKTFEDIGRKVVKAFNVRNRFFHLEFFKLNKAAKGLARKGEIVALETNMRPAGGYTPDLINFANSVSAYEIYGDSIAYDENRQKMDWPKYYAACASRRDDAEYVHSDDEILSKYHFNICHHGHYPKVFTGAMGDRFFMAKFLTLDQVSEFKIFVETRK